MFIQNNTATHIANGTWASSIKQNYSRNINGGVLGGVAGISYAWAKGANVWAYGFFGFMAGAIITGFVFPQKTAGKLKIVSEDKEENQTDKTEGQ